MGSTNRETLIITVALIIALGLVVMSLIMTLSGDNNDDDSSSEESIEHSDEGVDPTEGGAPAEASDGYAQSEFGQYRYAAIAEDAGPCSTVGVDILARKGGSAVDAAIATLVCVGVVNCHSSGIGGGHFMTIYDTPRGESEKVLNTILARERAPQAATEDMFVGTSDVSTFGGLAIGVPGELKGFYREWQKFGRVAWRDLFEPTIDMCRLGHPVNTDLAYAIQLRQEFIWNDTSLSELFVKADGSLVTEGDMIVRPKMAATLEIIADDPVAFYDPTSQLAQDIIADIADYNGIITLADLEMYEVYDEDPVRITLQNGNYTVYGPLPPSSGVIHNYALNILDGYNFSPESISTTEEAVLTYHRIAEAFKFAFAKRSALGDFNHTDIDELMRNLTSEDFADGTRARITDDMTHDIEYYDPAFEIVEDSGTAHVCVLAADGSAVSVTATINLRFGSKVRGRRTGIFFNNEMDDFSTPGLINHFGVPPSETNFIAASKMPMSSMSPSITLDGAGVVRFVGGASGGTRIITATAGVTMNALWLGMRNDVANNAHRIHHQLAPNRLRVEPGFDQDILAGLEAKGHEVEMNVNGYVQNIHNTCATTDVTSRDTACIHAASDGRKSGRPDGY